MSKVGIYVIAFAGFVSILTYFVAVMGIAHLIWALPLAILANIGILSIIIKEVKIPFRDMKINMRKVFAGDLDLQFTKEQLNRQDEIGKVFRLYQEYIQQLRKATEFADAIGRGDLTVQFEPSGEKDRLGHSLIIMRDQLKEAIVDVENMLSNAVQKGKLDTQISLENKNGVWLSLASEINELMLSFAKPLRALNEIISASAKGNMTLRYREIAIGEVKEVADSLNIAMDTISRMIAKISRSATKISQSSNEMNQMGEEIHVNSSEIASASAQISEGSRRQLTQFEEAFHMLEEIKSASGRIADQTDEIHTAAKKVADNSKVGVEKVDALVDEMGGISQESNHTEVIMRQLERNSGEITQIINVVNDLAKQTNMLALNAGIEAAQAGEYGKGFAVIAEEIRQLAQHSRKSTDEIEGIVKQVSAETTLALESVHKLNQSVNKSQQVIADAQQSFKEIYESSSANFQRSNQILSNVKDQFRRIDNVSRLSESIVVISEQTSAGSEEMAASAAELAGGMQQFNQLIESLVIIAEGLDKLTNQFVLDTAQDQPKTS